MAEIGWASLGVTPTFKDFGRNLDRGATPALSRYGKSAGSKFGKLFSSAAKVGIVGGLAAIGGAIKIGSDALSEATEAQKIGRQTAAVLKSTGGAAKVSKKDVGDLANQLSYMAGVDDELIQSGENVLLTFKGIRNEAGKGNRIFDRGTKAALNMSKALGTDLKGASIQVGKALNDPIKGLAALARVGVSFTEKQKAQITALVKGGDANAAVALGLVDSTTQYNALLKEQDGNAKKVYDTLTRDLTPAQVELFDHYSEGNHTLEAQKKILKELGSEFGGSARSQATASDRLKVAFGNVEESLGKGLLPLVQDFSRFLLRKGVPAAREFTRWFKNTGVPGIKDFADEVKPLARDLLPLAAEGFRKIKNFAKDAIPFAQGVVKQFKDMPGWVKKLLIGGAVGGLTAKKLGLGGLLKGAANTAAGGALSKGGSPLNPLWVKVVGGIGGLGDGGGGKGPKGGLLGSAGTIGLIAAVAGGVTLGVGKVLDKSGDTNLLGAGSGGSGSLPAGTFDMSDLEGEVKSVNKALSVTKSRWVDARLASQDYAFQVKNGIPRSALTTVTNWPLWNAKAKEYLATILEIRDTHMDTRLDRAGGSGATPGSGFDPSNGTRPHGRPRSDRAPTFNFYGDVRPNDSKQFFGDLQRKAIASFSTGGY